MAANRDKRKKSDDARARQRTWAAIIIATILVLSPVAAINYFVDNYNLLQGRSESRELRDYVANLRKAEFGVPYTYNDRSVKLLIAAQSHAHCLVVGTSQVMTMRQSSNPILAAECPSLDNAGVTGASFEDIITFLGIALNNPSVKTVVVGVSLWTFKRNTRLNWMRNMREMLEARKAFGLPTEPYDRMTLLGSEAWIDQLFSYKYLKINFKFLKRAFAGKTTMSYDLRSLTEKDLKKVMALRSDASISYPKEWKPTPSNENLGTTDIWVAPPYVDSEVVRELTTALEALQKANKKVVLYEGSYHPYVVDACPKPNICAAVPEVTAAAHAMAEKLNLSIIGSFLPQANGLTADDFIDFQHMRGSSLPKVGLQRAAH